MANPAQSGGGFVRKKREGVKAEINVTPLVDVVLVLLIIFMVVTPELEKGGAVLLPEISHGEKPGNKDEQKITITVSNDDRFYMDGEEIPRTDLLKLLQDKKQAGAITKRLYLKGDVGRPYGEMRDLFAELQKAGFTGVRLVVSSRGGESQ